MIYIPFPFQLLTNPLCFILEITTVLSTPLPPSKGVTSIRKYLNIQASQHLNGCSTGSLHQPTIQATNSRALWGLPLFKPTQSMCTLLRVPTQNGTFDPNTALGLCHASRLRPQKQRGDRFNVHIWLSRHPKEDKAEKLAFYYLKTHVF